MTARMTLCADDFAFSPGTSRVIAELAAAGRINAVSCMANMAGWRDDSQLLADVPRTCEIGLHITLTSERPIGRMPRFAPRGAMPEGGRLARMAYFGALPEDEIAAEVSRQFDAFESRLGRAPDFVDAHQHVHHLPALRSIVLAETAQWAPSAWVRSCCDSAAAMARRPFRLKAIGSAWHSRDLARDAARHGLAANTSFAGHYDFSPRFAAVLPAFFERPGRHHVIMTHPGADDRADDPIGPARVREAAVLRSFDAALTSPARGTSAGRASAAAR